MSARLLTIGLQGALHIREERISNRADACRLLYVSDIHLRPKRSTNLCQQVIDAVREAGASAVLLGGDLVDGPKELDNLSELVNSLGEIAPVAAIGGNHDRWVGMDQVRDAVVQGGGAWIHDGAIQIAHGSRTIAISGPQNRNRRRADVRILCAHNPRIWKTARHEGYDVVLAGHLHGCQLVAFEFRDRLFPGAIFYPYCYLSHQYRSCRLVVSRGVSDLVPIRWRCPREVIVCYV